MRDTLEAPEKQLTANGRKQRDALLLKLPEYGEAMTLGRQLQSELQARWHEGLDDQTQRELDRTWRDWAENLRLRESMIAEMGLERVPADAHFPPVIATTELQSRLQPGQAVAVFHETSGGLIGFLVTAKSSTSWRCEPTGRLAGRLRKLLRALGNYDAAHELTAEEIASEDWIDAGGAVYAALFAGSSLDPAALTELIVVPDGIVWYVPFAALPVEGESQVVPLISAAQLRVAPTVGLAFSRKSPLRRVQRSGIVGREILPGETDDAQEEPLAALRDALVQPIELTPSGPVSSAVMGSLVETLVVLDSIELDATRPYAWSPIAAGRKGRQSTLSHWLELPQFGRSVL